MERDFNNQEHRGCCGELGTAAMSGIFKAVEISDLEQDPSAAGAVGELVDSSNRERFVLSF